MVSLYALITSGKRPLNYEHPSARNSFMNKYSLLFIALISLQRPLLGMDLESEELPKNMLEIGNILNKHTIHPVEKFLKNGCPEITNSQKKSKKTFVPIVPKELLEEIIAEYIQKFSHTFTIDPDGIIQNDGKCKDQKLTNQYILDHLIKHQTVTDLLCYQYKCGDFHMRNNEPSNARKLHKEHIQRVHGGDATQCGDLIIPPYELHYEVRGLDSSDDYLSANPMIYTRRIHFNKLKEYVGEHRKTKSFEVEIKIQMKEKEQPCHRRLDYKYFEQLAGKQNEGTQS